MSEQTGPITPIQAFEQEKELSREAKEARLLAAKFRDQTAGWVAAARRADAVMRDFGDHEAFLQAIQDDMADVTSMLQRISQVACPANAVLLCHTYLVTSPFAKTC